jgi:hypothetical protein
MKLTILSTQLFRSAMSSDVKLTKASVDRLAIKYKYALLTSCIGNVMFVMLVMLITSPTLILSLVSPYIKLSMNQTLSNFKVLLM